MLSTVRRVSLALLAPTLLNFATPLMAQTRLGPPPISRSEPIVESLHGVQVADPYRWLEDQSAPEVRQWLDAQIAYTTKALGSVSGREGVRKRFEELLKVDSYSAPTERNGAYFFLRRLVGEQQFSLCMRKGPKGKIEVLLDPKTMSRDAATSIVPLDYSQDASLIAFGLREGGVDETGVQLYSVASRSPLADSLPRARYLSVQIAPDGKHLYYAVHSAQGPRVRVHRMGTSAAEDRDLFGSGYGQEKLISIELSADGAHIVATVHYGSAAQRTEVHLVDTGTGKSVAIVDDLNAKFTPTLGGKSLFLQTTWNAPNGKVVAVDLTNPTRSSWKEIIAERKQPLQSMVAAGGRLIATYLDNVQHRVEVINPASGAVERQIKLPGLGSITGLNGEWDRPELSYTFTSFNMPPTSYRYEVATGKQAVWEKSRAKLNSADYEVVRADYKSKDGTSIPIYLVHKKGIAKDGNRPVFLTGYGGFNQVYMPAFTATAIQIAEAGGVYAQPCLRGGGEFGEAWHRAGMLEKKQNVFDDFIAAAEWLIQQKYTSTDRIAISGGSNGGLLVGAFLTQRPDLCRAVLCSVPLLDMVRYHQFLVARFWVPEYGSSEDASQFKTLLAYSPYHQVKSQVSYPAVMFVTGDSDTRVAPLHARKMAALMQSVNKDAEGRPVLLHYDLKAGHSAGLPIDKVIDDATDNLTFVLWQLGVLSRR